MSIHLSLLILIRVVFLTCLGICLLTDSKLSRIVAGVLSIVLAVFVLIGVF